MLYTEGTLTAEDRKLRRVARTTVNSALRDGAAGGRWERLHSDADIGGWGAGKIPCAAGRDPAEILPGANLSVFIRNDGVFDFRYKKWTIREIAPQ